MRSDHALILAQPFAGLQAQALGLAERAGLKSTIAELHAVAPWRLLPPAIWPRPLSCVRMLTESDADALVLSVGGMGAAVAAAWRRQGRTVVQIQNPRMRLSRFDLVVTNTHDEVSGPNVLVSRTALHRVTPAALAAARAVWAPRFAHLRRPLVAVLVGGSNGRFRLDAASGAALAAGLAAMMRRDAVGLMLTPSRRTDPAVRAALAACLEPLGAWIWNFEGDNPYLGMLACADCIIVTMDSVSMVSEAAATSAPVLVAELPGRSRRIGLFLRTMQQAGRIRMFAARMQDWQATPLDDTAMVADAMRVRLHMRETGQVAREGSE